MLPIKDSTGMTSPKLTQGKRVIDGIIKEHFTKEEIADFKAGGITMEIKKLPPDIAGQSEGKKIYFDPDTINRADAVTEDVVVHELVHAYNRFRENRNPATFTRRESTLEGAADVQNDIEIEEAVTEAITSSRLAKFDEKSKTPIATKRGDLHKRYNRTKATTRTLTGRLPVINNGISAYETALTEELQDRIAKIAETAEEKEARAGLKAAFEVITEARGEYDRIFGPVPQFSVTGPDRKLERVRPGSEYDAFKDHVPMTREEALQEGVMHPEVVREFHEKKAQFNKAIVKEVRDARAELGGRIRFTNEEKEKMLTAVWLKVYGTKPPKHELSKSNTRIMGNNPANTGIIWYDEDQLDQTLHLDSFDNQTTTNRRYKVGGEIKNFPLAAIGYDEVGLEKYAEQLREYGFYVRKVKAKADYTASAARWALFVHPKSNYLLDPKNTHYQVATELAKLYAQDPAHPQFGAKLRRALESHNKGVVSMRGPALGHSIVLQTMTPMGGIRKAGKYDEGPVASDVRLYYKAKDRELFLGLNERLAAAAAIFDPRTDALVRAAAKGQPPHVSQDEPNFRKWLIKMGAPIDDDFAKLTFEEKIHILAQYRLNTWVPPRKYMRTYRLNAIPVDVSNIVGPMIGENPTGIGLDERAGQVYDLTDAYVVVNEFDNQGRLEQITMGVYATEEAARRSIAANVLYDGEMLIHEVPGADVWDFYRRWPYYFRQGGEQWLKKGIKGEEVRFESVGFTAGNRPTRITRNWLEQSLEAETSLEEGGNPITNAAYFRRLSGKTFRGVGGILSKNHARLVAENMRHAGYNARVIPNARGHRVYLRQKPRARACSCGTRISNCDGRRRSRCGRCTRLGR